jgi:hypothetical protein
MISLGVSVARPYCLCFVCFLMAFFGGVIVCFFTRHDLCFRVGVAMLCSVIMLGNAFTQGGSLIVGQDSSSYLCSSGL